MGIAEGAAGGGTVGGIAAANALLTGGILLSFLPTILQVQELVLALNDHDCFAHSGFITTAVRCQPPARQGYARSP